MPIGCHEMPLDASMRGRISIRLSRRGFLFSLLELNMDEEACEPKAQDA